MSTPDQRDRRPEADADVCIVGSGPAGALVADTLAGHGHQVVVLEAGPKFDPTDRLGRMERELRPSFHRSSVWGSDEDRDAFESVGGVDYPVNFHRVKGVGGSTLHWGSSIARFPEAAFETRTRWGIGADWPIGYDDLKPYYADAERELGVAGAQDDPFSPPRDEPYPMDAFPKSPSDELFEAACAESGVEIHSGTTARNTETYDDRSQCLGYGTCAPVCPSGAKYSADIHVEKATEKGARLIDRAVVQRFEHDGGGDRVTGAVYRTPDGGTHTQRADQFVLAAGGVENPRLLLLSDSPAHPDGLANSSGVVGNYLMDHIYTGIVGELDTSTFQHQGTPVGYNSHQFVTPEAVPPGSFKIEFGNNAGPKLTDIALQQRQPLRSIQSLSADPTDIQDWQRLGRDTAPIQWGDELLETMRERYGNYFTVRSSIEVLPRADNRIGLNDTTTDAYGNPVPEVDWGQFGEYEEATMDRSFEVMADIVSNLEPEVLWQDRFEVRSGVAHPAGTTRMGTDPDESVVTPDLRTHDVENLYVAGSSVFPTESSQQPTLTIAALALRLGEHLHELLS